MDQQNPNAPTCAQRPPGRRVIAGGFVRRTPANARLAELHRLCREDYDSNAARRAQNHRDDTFLIAPSSPEQADEPQTEEERARRFVDRHFPTIAAFLAAERGGAR
ncbi:hypothetical protein ACFVAF_18135 [Streptomyces sp. NPDC057596]|uniref:hypothetical protein n=1 Tax=Streptomyces sp. NPDC057596 TaxID=3346178 RepID=UPI0036BF2220